MCKQILFLLILSLFQCIQGMAQESVTGVVKNRDAHPLEAAHVALCRGDSVVHGTTTDRRGGFHLAGVNGGDYVLRVSMVGYRTLWERIVCGSGKVDLGVLQLVEESEELEEVKVEEVALNRSDRVLVYPSERQVKFAANGIDLLQQMQLHRLSVNPIDQTVEATGGGAVGFCIDGRPVEQAEVMAISPKDVLRVEYIDRPGLRFRDKEAVINFVMKVKEGGGLLALQADNTPWSKYGTNLLLGKFHHKKSEVGVSYSFKYTDRIYHTYEWEHYVFKDGRVLEREWKSGDGGMNTKHYVHAPSFYYSNREENKYFFNAAVQLVQFRAPGATSTQTMGENNIHAISRVQSDAEKNYAPALKLYFDRHLRGNQFLALNLVGTYTNNLQSSAFVYREGDSIASQGGIRLDGEKLSWIGEVVYEKQWGKHGLSVGVKDAWMRTDNCFSSGKNNRTKLTNNLVEAWIEWSLTSGKWKSMVSLGGDSYYLAEQRQERLLWNYRLIADFNYFIDSRSYAKLRGGVYNNHPNLMFLNEFENPKNDLLMEKGNPDATSWRTMFLQLAYSFRQKEFGCHIYGNYTYDHHPFMDQVDVLDDQFIMTVDKQKSLQMLQIQASGWCKLWQDYLSVQIAPYFGYFLSRGNSYTHRTSFLNYTASLIGTYKNWQMTFQMRNRYKRLFGEFMQYGQIYDSLILSYHSGGLLLSVGIREFLGRNYKSSWSESLTPHQRSYSYYTYRPASIFFKLSYTLSFGKGVKSGKQRLDNEDSGEGVFL